MFDLEHFVGRRRPSETPKATEKVTAVSVNNGDSPALIRHGDIRFPLPQFPTIEPVTQSTSPPTMRGDITFEIPVFPWGTTTASPGTTTTEAVRTTTQLDTTTRIAGTTSSVTMIPTSFPTTTTTTMESTETTTEGSMVTTPEKTPETTSSDAAATTTGSETPETTAMTTDAPTTSSTTMEAATTTTEHLSTTTIENQYMTTTSNAPAKTTEVQATSTTESMASETTTNVPVTKTDSVTQEITTATSDLPTTTDTSSTTEKHTSGQTTTHAQTTPEYITTNRPFTEQPSTASSTTQVQTTKGPLTSARLSTVAPTTQTVTSPVSPSTSAPKITTTKPRTTSGGFFPFFPNDDFEFDDMWDIFENDGSDSSWGFLVGDDSGESDESFDSLDFNREGSFKLRAKTKTGEEGPIVNNLNNMKDIPFEPDQLPMVKNEKIFENIDRALDKMYFDSKSWLHVVDDSRVVDKRTINQLKKFDRLLNTVYSKISDQFLSALVNPNTNARRFRKKFRQASRM